jgi:drug/metabolite transporter (DMT)-like permease
LIAARVASITAFVIAMLIAREPFKIEREGLPATLIAGGADMGANILFLLASQSGMLSLVAIITSLFPAPTVILARIFLHQRIPPARLAGLILALTGVGLISLR